MNGNFGKFKDEQEVSSGNATERQSIKQRAQDVNKYRRS